MLTYYLKTSALLLIFVLHYQTQNNNTIIIFADKANTALATEQTNILNADTRGIKNRNIVVKTVIWSDKNAAEYKKWHVSNMPFTLLLIGKDDGEKLRSHKPVALAKIYDLIDNAPTIQQVHYHNQ